MNEALMPSAERLYFLNGSPENGGYGELLFNAETKLEAARSSVAAYESMLMIDICYPNGSSQYPSPPQNQAHRYETG